MLKKFGEGCEVVILLDFLIYTGFLLSPSLASSGRVVITKENHCTYTFDTSSQPFL